MKKSAPTPIIFHAKEVPFSRCTVDLIDDLLAVQSDEAKVILRNEPKIEKLMDVFKPSAPPEGAILFTHGHPSKLKFINAAKSSDAHWWTMDRPLQLLLGYACHSALILEQKEWKTVFKDWVGSLGPLKYSTDAPSGELWKIFFSKIIEHFDPDMSGEDFLEAIGKYTYECVELTAGRPDLTNFRTLIIDNLEFLTCKKLRA